MLAQASVPLCQLRTYSQGEHSQRTREVVVSQVQGGRICRVHLTGQGSEASLHVSSEDCPLADGALAPAPRRHRSRLWHLYTLARNQLVSTLLPADYPGSVGPNYLRYVGWQAVTHGTASANGVLASTFLLYSVGLGAGAIPTAGAISWVLKDGLGQLGTLLFGKTIAHKFDVNAKTWYILAAASVNVAMGLEILTMASPQHFLAVASVANMLKGLSWMAGGSTRTAFNVSFVRESNIADITAKATSQTICTSLLGTTAGLALASSIGQSIPLALAAFASLGCAHMFSTFMCVKSIPLASLNTFRLQLLIDDYIAAVCSSGQPPAKSPPRLPTPLELAKRDPALGLPRLLRDHRFLPTIVVGTPIARLFAHRPGLLAELVRVFAETKHMVVPDGRGDIHVLLRPDACASGSLAGYLHACLLRHALRQGTQGADGSNPEDGTLTLLEETLAWSADLAPQLMHSLQAAGWDTDRMVIEPLRQRAEWAVPGGPAAAVEKPHCMAAAA